MNKVGGCALQTGPYQPDLSRHLALRDFTHWITCVTPSALAGQTRIVWSCRHVPPLSGLLPTLPGVPRVGLPPASPGRCDGLPAESFHLHMVKWRPVAHVVVLVLAEHGGGVGRPRVPNLPEPEILPTA